jgi:hypothetical protein
VEAGGEEGYWVVINTILKVISTLLIDQKAEVR